MSLLIQSSHYHKKLLKMLLNFLAAQLTAFTDKFLLEQVRVTDNVLEVGVSRVWDSDHQDLQSKPGRAMAAILNAGSSFALFRNSAA